MRKVVCLSILVAGWAQRTWYFSSSQGNDTNDGRTPATALQSVTMLQRLLDGQAVGGERLGRGDTIAFMRGDTFRVVREEAGQLRYGIDLNRAVFRQGGAPIVFTAYGGGSGKPVFVGTWRLSDWTQGYQGSGPIVKIGKPFGGHDSLVVLRVFWRGEPLPLARHPNDTLFVIEGAYGADRGDNDTLVSRGVGGLGAGEVAGALVVASLGSDYSWGCNKVVGKSGDSLIVLSWAGAESPLRRARFYLEGRLHFIDRPGEWYYDEVGDTLYIYPPTSSFDMSEYEVMVVRVRVSDRDVQYGRGLILTASYDTMPTNPIQGVIIEGLGFFGLGEGVRLAGVREVTIRDCEFRHNWRGIWNFLANDLYIRRNEFLWHEHSAVSVGGRMPAGYVGHPKAMTRRVYVEGNVVKYTGLASRWDWQRLRVDLARFVMEDYSLRVGSNTDSVFIRYNRIDSVSQGGIGGYSFYWTDSLWARAYAGTVPFVIEKNYITNFCMDFADCGGIKVGSFINNGVIRDNILVKGVDRDKSHLSNIYRVRGKGLYTDVGPQDVLIEANTVVGAHEGSHNFGGGGPIQNIKIRGNTFYNSRGQGCNVVTGSSAQVEVDGVEVTGNIFFLGMQGSGAVAMEDYNGNGRPDTLDIVDANWYGHPTYACSYYYRRQDGQMFIYGFRAMRERTPYERSPGSRWIAWVGYRAWEGAQAVRSLVSNPGLDPNLSLPVQAFGRARLQLVSVSPFGGPAYLVWYPDTAPAGVFSGVRLRSSEALYTTTLEPGGVYRWTIVWASNKAKDYSASSSYFRYIHPNTGDTLGYRDNFVLPVYRSYEPETVRVRYEPRFRQFWTLPYIQLERGDSVWLRYWDFEEIDRASVPTLEEVYPIVVNPSDTVAYVPLPSGWVYLTLDSTVVWGRVRVEPWKSKVLVRVRYDSSLVGLAGMQRMERWAIVYPNPTFGRVRVLVPEPAAYEVISMGGMIVGRGTVEGEGELSLEGLPAGVYLLRLRYKSGDAECVRIVKE